MILTKGQSIRIRSLGASDEWCPATVALVSEDVPGAAISVGLLLHGAVRAPDPGGFFVGGLALFIDEQREKVTGLFDEEYEIEIEAPCTA